MRFRPLTRDEIHKIHVENIKQQTRLFTYEDIFYDMGDTDKEVNKMPIIFQPRIVGNGPYKHARWVEKRVKKMCAEIVRAKMVEETGETEESLFCRLESKYGTKWFSDLRIHIDRGSVKYDAPNMTWYGVFRVVSRDNPFM